MSTILEKDLINIFEEKSLIKFQNLLKVDELRVHSYEFPMEYHGDKGKIDMILEIVKEGNLFNKENSLLILEFKKDKITYGPIDQINFYMKNIRLKQYRKSIEGYLVAPHFSVHEIEEAKKNNVHCLMLNENGDIKLIC